MNRVGWILKEVESILSSLSPKQKVINLATGYGPSGSPHIGTLAEVIRTNMIKILLEENGYEVKLFCICDDMDALRKIPFGVDKKFEEFIGCPLYKVPDPQNNFSSWAESNLQKLKNLIGKFNIKYEMLRASDLYINGFFNPYMTQVGQNYNEISQLVKNSIGEARASNYSPFLPILDNKVLQAKVLNFNLEGNFIEFEHQNKKYIKSIHNGECKLQWKVDWAMRWHAMRIDYEMYGKDMIDSHFVARKIVNCFGNKAPLGLCYQMFVDDEGKKLSKSKGNNAFTVEDWLEYSSPQSLVHFLCSNPRSTNHFSFKELIAHTNEYCKNEETAKQEMIRRVTFYKGNVKINFSMILYLARFIKDSTKLSQKLFLSIYSEEEKAIVKTLCKQALKINEKIGNIKEVFFEFTKQDLLALKELKDEMLNCNTEEDVRKIVYDIGNKHYENKNLSNWFKVLYRVFFGSNEGPRIPSFIFLYGIKESTELIEERMWRNR